MQNYQVTIVEVSCSYACQHWNSLMDPQSPVHQVHHRRSGQNQLGHYHSHRVPHSYIVENCELLFIYINSFSLYLPLYLSLSLSLSLSLTHTHTHRYVWSKITFGLDYWSGGKFQVRTRARAHARTQIHTLLRLISASSP